MMDKEVITFCNMETAEHKFHCFKNPIFFNNVDIDNINI